MEGEEDTPPPNPPASFSMSQSGLSDAEEDVLRAKLAQLVQEHRDMDSAISAMGEQGVNDQLQLTRLKKRKLQLKDQIARIEDALLPDIIA